MHEKAQEGQVLSLIIICLLALIVCLGYFGIALVSPNFDNLFRGFGADLPEVTRLALIAGPYLMVFCIPALVPFVYYFRGAGKDLDTRTRMLAFSVGNFVFAIVVIAAWFAAVYLPIFKMGAVVE